MTPVTQNDPLLKAVASLPHVLPDRARAERVLLTCRARIQQPPHQLPHALEPAGVASICIMYAWQIVRLVIR